jgi:ABC-type Fe3+/spermidine/putrescine transport system ATPase subunit
VTSPSLLLLDEPLGALDLKLRREMGAELRALHRRIKMTFLYVTHDQEEALSMSDEVVVIHKGRIRQHGTPDELYWRPRTPFVADFVGEANVLSGSVLSTEGGVARVRWGNNIVRLTPDRIGGSGDDVQLALRAERISIGEEALGRANHFTATVEEFRFYGGHNEIVVRLVAGNMLRVRRAAGMLTAGPRPGDTVTVGWEPADCTVLEAE